MQTQLIRSLGCLVLALACPAQRERPQPPQTWEPVKTAVAPAARCGHAMAYDSNRQRTVLFGGFDPAANSQGKQLDDTWEWDGANWVEIPPDAAPPPPAREHHSMVFDAQRQQLVLFGGFGPQGNGLGYFADTWVFDGVRWTEVTPPNSPPARSWSAMAYDSERDRVVLFGGFPSFADTWEWDGTTWTEVQSTTSPTARWAHDMVFDQSRNRIVLFGGHTGAYAKDTWELVGLEWQRLQPTNEPMPCGRHKMVFDPRLSRVVMFGGLDGLNFSGATWTFQDDDWAVAQLYGDPAARADHAMVYDIERNRIVLFGGMGKTVLGDTWELTDGVVGTFTEYGVACGSPNVLQLCPKFGTRPVMGSTFTLVAEYQWPESAPGLMFAGWSREVLAGPGGIKLPLALDFVGMPGCELYQSLDFAWPLPLVGGRGELSFLIPIDPRLVGAELYFQAFYGTKASNGGAVRVGSL